MLSLTFTDLESAASTHSDKIGGFMYPLSLRCINKDSEEENKEEDEEVQHAVVALMLSTCCHHHHVVDVLQCQRKTTRL